jgi:hypothetical protein
MITNEWLRDHPNYIFVFGDNTIHRGHGGAASLRDNSNAYGFITKRFPTNEDKAFYDTLEYLPVFAEEIEKLKKFITLHPNKKFLISKLGAGLANKYSIWESIIEPSIKPELKSFNNVEFLW